MKKFFKLKLKTITPIHIFAGDYFYDYEFFIKESKFYLVNFDKIIKNIYLKNYFYLLIDSFFQKKNYFEFKKELNNFYLKNFDYLEQKGIIFDEIDLDLEDKNIFRLQSEKIYKFITYYDIKKEKKEIFIPGSSIKGAFFDILKRYFGDNYSDDLRYKIGFTDFYFSSKKTWIQRITRIKPTKERLIKGNKITIQLAEGEADGEIFFEEKLEKYLRNLFYEGGEIVMKKRKFNASYSYFFSQELMDKIKTSENLIMLLGFGSLSYESNKISKIKRKNGKLKTIFHKNPSMYYSYNQKDPLGVISLEIID